MTGGQGMLLKRGMGNGESGIGTRDSGLGTRDLGLGTREWRMKNTGQR